MRRLTAPTTLIAGALALLPLGARAQTYAVPAEDVPRLVVVLSIDQFRGDYYDRFRKYFGSGGFLRLVAPGRYYETCYYAHANTLTGPGHATMLTGTYAHLNGITGNAWYSEVDKKTVYCVSDPATKFISSYGPLDGSAESSPLLAAVGLDKGEESAASPRALMAGTVGDVLESATNGKAKTLSISTKDRAAVLMGGKGCDLALWWKAELGEFVTSDYYTNELPAWISDFNKAKPADKHFKKAWDLSLAPANYEELCTADDYPAEGTGNYTSRTFPHILGEKSDKPNKSFYDTISMSPFANDIIVDAAIEALRKDELGKDTTPDLLTLSFSSNDLIGHTFGPRSWEVMDAAIKTDKSIERLLQGLDETVGAGKWTIFVTADHGVAEFPETLLEQGIDAGRVKEGDMRVAIETRLQEVYGPTKPDTSYVKSISVPWISIEPDSAATPIAATAPPMDQTIVDFLYTQPTISFATTTKELLAVPANNNALRQAILFAYYPKRSGQVAFALKPNYYFGGSTGTTHGSPWRYDQAVPLFVCGRGIIPGRSNFLVTPPQIAPTISLILQIPWPSNCEVTALPNCVAGRM